MKNYILPLLTAIIITLASPLFAKQFDCIVTVVDTEGRPIKNADVSVWGHNYGIDNNNNFVEQLGSTVQTNTDGNARIRFEPNTTENNIFVFASKTGFAVGWNGIYDCARILKIRIVLDRINSTGGIVTDEQGQSIVGAKVTAYPADDVMVEGAQSNIRWPGSILTTTTDHEGRFSYDCFAEWTKVSFDVEHPGRARTNTTYDIEGKSLDRYKAGSKDIHITMHPEGQIEGKVIAARVNDAKGITLTARGERIRTGHTYTATSDDKGNFTFRDLPPDTYLVTAATLKDDLRQQLTVGARVDVESGKTASNVKIRMRRPIALDVIVKNAKTKQPIENASIYLTQRKISKFAGHLTYTTTTDNSGIAKVLLLPGKFNIYVDHEDFDYSSGDYLVKSTDKNLLMGLRPKSIVSGQVVYEDGSKASGVEVAASTVKTERKLTDRNGRFRIVYSESMSQKRFVIARDIEKNLAGAVNITENNGEPVKIVLSQAATLKGRVTDPDDRPIKMARIAVVYKIPYFMMNIDSYLHTDEDGRFELRAVPYVQKDFEYRLSVSAYGYGKVEFAKIQVEKDMGEIIELPQLVLKPCDMSVSGIAYYNDGRVAGNRSVHLNEAHNLKNQPSLHTVTDEKGRFQFDGVCQGWLRIQCGYASESTNGHIRAKGGDNIKAFLECNYQSLQTHTTAESYLGVKMPMYETLTNGIDSEVLENKKLLVCFWYMGEEKGKKNVKELTKIADGLDKAGITVILVNARPYSRKYASINIDSDKKWINDNKVPFIEADLTDLEDIMDLRRAAGARFIPHMILTDESKIITREGFDIKWLKKNAL